MKNQPHTTASYIAAIIVFMCIMIPICLAAITIGILLTASIAGAIVGIPLIFIGVVGPFAAVFVAGRDIYRRKHVAQP